VIAPTIVARLLEHTRQSGSLAEQTSRDRELLGLMAEGHSNRGICQRLFLSPKTVESTRPHDLLQARPRGETLTPTGASSP